LKHKKAESAANLKKKIEGQNWHFLKVLGAPAMLLGAPSNTLVLGKLDKPSP